MGLTPPPLPFLAASAPLALRASSASGGRGLSFGAGGAFAPLAGPSPAPAANAAGRVKSRRPDYGLACRALLVYERRQERETLSVIRIGGGCENQEHFGAILKREYLTVE